MKIIKKTENTQRLFDDAGNTQQRISGATYEIKMNDGRCAGTATVHDGGSVSISINGIGGDVEAMMALTENLIGNFNEQQ